MRLLKLQIRDAMFPIPYTERWLPEKGRKPPSMAEYFEKRAGIAPNIVAVLCGDVPVWHTKDGDVQFGRPTEYYNQARAAVTTYEGLGRYQLLTGRPDCHRNPTSHVNRRPSGDLIEVAKLLGVGPNTAVALAKTEPERFLEAARKVVGDKNKDSSLLTPHVWFRGGDSPLANAQNVNNSYLYNQNSQSPILCVVYDGLITLEVSVAMYGQVISGVGFTSVGRGGIACVSPA